MGYAEDVKAIEAELDTDVLALFGPIERGLEDRIITQCHNRRKRANVLLLVATRGGDPSAAYKIARCIQTAYATRGEDPKGRFDVAVHTICKSAGTLICIGADRIFMTAHAELGPIDIQLRKPEEVGERTSGLTPLQALDTLKVQSLSLFKNHFRQLRFDDELVFSTKAAAEIATKLTVGLMGPVYGQIDPIRLAEVERAIRISGDYAERITTKNLKQDALPRLLARYPSHGFVIDRIEAAELFEKVEQPGVVIYRLITGLENFSNRYLDSTYAFFAYLSDEPEPPPPVTPPGGPDVQGAQNDGPGNQGEGGGNAQVRGDDRTSEIGPDAPAAPQPPDADGAERSEQAPAVVATSSPRPPRKRGRRSARIATN